ncbi:MAG: response regulator transcription factor [Anaerolineales bacterium]
MIRVLVVASTLALRAGLRALIESAQGLLVTAEISHLAELETLPPDTDVIVCTSVSGLLAQFDRLTEEQVSYPGLLLLADEPRAARTLRRLPLRAWGVLPLDASQEELTAALGALHEGLSVVPADFLEEILEGELEIEALPEKLLVESLTQRESEVLQLVAHGLANKQIALELEISEHTVKYHISSIYAKLGVSNRIEAVKMGFQNGLIVL